MKNNLITKIVYRTVYCTVSFYAILFITGFFSVGGHNRVTFNDELFYYYTNLSNFLCFGVMLACLCDNIKQIRTGVLYGYIRNPYLKYIKYMATMIIAMTFLAYFFIEGDPDTLRFWNNIANISYHIACPILFIFDTILFHEHKSVGYLDPIISIFLPLIYVTVIEILGSVTGDYPYFFLDLDILGYKGLIKWCGILLTVFVILGYLLFLYDKLVKVDGKWRFDFSNTPSISFLVKKKEHIS